MSEVDLIPAEFRHRQRLRARLKFAGVSYGLLCLLILAAKLWLGQALHGEQARIDTLTSEENLILQQRQTYDDLHNQRSRLNEYLTVLKELRGGPKAEQMFVVIDRAINDGVWMTSLKFLRAGVKMASPLDGQKGGYLVVAPSRAAAGDEQWANALRMEISGQAVDHSALAEFVNTLQDQPEVAEVKLQDTSQTPFMSGYVIAYQLSIKVVSPGGGE